MNETDVRVAILASGDLASGKGGSTANRVARDSLEQDLGFTIGVVVCNNPRDSVGVYPLFEQINTDYNLKGDDRIDVVHIGPRGPRAPGQTRGQTPEESAAICDLLEDREIEFVSMLGYLTIAKWRFLQEWGWMPKYANDPNPAFSYRQGLYHPSAKTMNNHPGILPFTKDTHGPKTHELAVKLHQQGKLDHTAMTWHLMAEEIDAGPIVTEIAVKIEDEYVPDNLSDAVQDVEKAETALVLANHLKLRSERAYASS